MLPHVVGFNAERSETRHLYRDLAVFGGLVGSDATDDDGVAVLIARLRNLLTHAGMPASLAECGVSDDIIPQLALEASRQWTAQFNPREPSAQDFEALYRAALH